MMDLRKDGFKTSTNVQQNNESFLFLRKVQSDDESFRSDGDASNQTSFSLGDGGFVGFVFFAFALTCICGGSRLKWRWCDSNRDASSSPNNRQSRRSQQHRNRQPQPQRIQYRNIDFESLLTKNTMTVESKHLKIITSASDTTKSGAMESKKKNDASIDVEMGEQMETNSGCAIDLTDSTGHTQKTEENDENVASDNEKMESASSSIRQFFNSPSFSLRQSWFSSRLAPESTTMLELPPNNSEKQKDPSKDPRHWVPITCAICLSSYKTGKMVSWATNAAECCHAFHTKCIAQYAQSCFERHQEQQAQRGTENADHKHERLSVPCPLCRNPFLTYRPVSVEEAP